MDFLKVQDGLSLVSRCSPYGKMERMDKSTWLGLLVGFGAILLGNTLEGGHFASLVQFTALLIVLGGTAGAVFVSHPKKDLVRSFELFKTAFREPESDFSKNVLQIVECTKIAKKDTLLAVEKALPGITDPFLRKVMRTVVDGIDPQVVRDIYETEIDAEEEELLGAVKVWTDAGGYSPTIGIIGAVLGLIHIMGNLTDTSKLGSGIAVAFVATIYGVSFANLVFLPVSSKLKKRVQRQISEKRMILEGALLVNSGLASSVVQQKMNAFSEGAEARIL